MKQRRISACIVSQIMFLMLTTITMQNANGQYDSQKLGDDQSAENDHSYRVAAVEYRICSQMQDTAENNYKLGRQTLNRLAFELF